MPREITVDYLAEALLTAYQVHHELKVEGYTCNFDVAEMYRGRVHHEGMDVEEALKALQQNPAGYVARLTSARREYDFAPLFLADAVALAECTGVQQKALLEERLGSARVEGVRTSSGLLAKVPIFREADDCVHL